MSNVVSGPHLSPVSSFEEDVDATPMPRADSYETEQLRKLLTEEASDGVAREAGQPWPTMGNGGENRGSSSSPAEGKPDYAPKVARRHFRERGRARAQSLQQSHHVFTDEEEEEQEEDKSLDSTAQDGDGKDDGSGSENGAKKASKAGVSDSALARVRGFFQLDYRAKDEVSPKESRAADLEHTHAKHVKSTSLHIITPSGHI